MTMPGVVFLTSCDIYISARTEPQEESMYIPEVWLGVYRIKKWLQDRNLAKVLVLDPNVDWDIPGQMVDFAEKNPIPLLGVSMTHLNIEKDLQNIKTLQDLVLSSGLPSPVTLAGGYEPTLNSDQVLSLGYVQAVVQGYGEFALEALLTYYNSLREPGPDALRGACFPGLIWKQGLLEGTDLTPEEMPDPSRLFSYQAQPFAEIPWSKYWSGEATSSSDRGDSYSKKYSFFTSSHCQAACGFCSSRRYAQFTLKSLKLPSSVLMLSAEEVAELVLKAYNSPGSEKPGSIIFHDDDFVVGGKKGMARFEEFCDLMQEHFKKGNLPDWLFFTMKTKIRHFAADPKYASFSGGGKEAMRRIKRAGFKVLALGVESFSDELLDSPFINKHVAAEVNTQVVMDALETGMVPFVFYIAFPPNVTRENFSYSLEKLIDVLEKGAWLGLALTIQVNSGTVARELFDDPAWPGFKKKISDTWGQELELPEYLLPADPVMRKALDRAHEHHFSKLKESKRSQISSYELLADTAQFLGYEDLYHRLNNLIAHNRKE